MSNVDEKDVTVSQQSTFVIPDLTVKDLLGSIP